MPIMYHSVTEDDTSLSTDNTQITHSYLEKTLKRAYELGYKTITVEQLVSFLERNARIPARSLLLIVDDRRPGVVREHFMPLLEHYNWSVTLAWPIADTDSKPASYINKYPNEKFSSLWEQMEAYYATGRLDIQSHGYNHNINIGPYSSEEFLIQEIYGSKQALQNHFYCKDLLTKKPVPNCPNTQPMAFIWPGGNFTKKGAEVARKAGYRVGFSINPRGPLMYNWIPLGEKTNPALPEWLPEVPIEDPLMVLPRYWSVDALARLEEVTAIGTEAATEALKNRPIELEFMQRNCP